MISQLSATIRVLELYRQQNGLAEDKPLRLLARRLVRIRSRFEKAVSNNSKKEK